MIIVEYKPSGGPPERWATDNLILENNRASVWRGPCGPMSRTQIGDLIIRDCAGADIRLTFEKRVCHE